MAAEEQLHRAKRPVSILAGPYGHPIHPILVTVPIGCWIASFLFDLASRLVDDADDVAALAKGAYWLIGLGVVAALLAALAGALDLLAIPVGTKAFRIGLLHMALNLVVVALFAISWGLRRGELDPAEETAGGPLALSAVALALLGASGWLGGQLSFRYGVRVADEAAQVEGFVGGGRRADGPD